ncbi:MAG TPA: FAD-dependent oxidoreductase, partial [Kofleriaceae bacterium]|nr:FAD-dependent oxidoreductase [Kofleriaceae bacterium]
YMIKCGSQKLIDQLLGRLTGTIKDKIKDEKQSGDEPKPSTNTIVKLNHNHTVTRLVRQAGNWIVRFTNKPGEDNENTDNESFDDVILALPQHAIKRLDIEEEKNGSMTRISLPRWVDWVQPHRLFKLFLVYKKAWWIGDPNPDMATGRIYTDLPLRQVFYFSPDWMQRHSSVQSNSSDHAMIMASYSDAQHVAYWAPTLGEVDGRFIRFFNEPGMESNRHPYSSVPPDIWASERLIEKVQQQLSVLHGNKQIPKPLFGIFKDWGAPPFGGGWHTWSVNDRPSNTEYHKLAQQLYQCGEAYSDEQGWVEGALKSAERLIFHLEHEMQNEISDESTALPNPHFKQSSSDNWMSNIEDLVDYIGVVNDAIADGSRG